MKEGQSSNLHGASTATQIATTKKITKSPRVKWNDLEKKKFLLLYCQDTNNGIKEIDPEIWENIREKMINKLPNFRRSTEKLRQLQRDLKKSYISKIQDPINNHSFTFNRETLILEGSDEVWQKAIEADPKFQRLRGKKFEDYYAELDILYGDWGASSGNHQVPGSDADHSAQPYTASSVATRKHGGMDQTLGLPTYHQTQTNTEQVIDRLPQLRIADDSSPPSAKNSRQYPGMSTSIQSIDNEQPQIHAVASSSHFNAKNHGKNPDAQNLRGCNPQRGTSITDCLNEYYKCGFTKDDLDEATEIFRDPEYREMFIAFDKDRRPHWLRQLIIARRQQKQRGMLHKPN